MMKKCAAMLSLASCALAALVAQSAYASTGGFKVADFTEASWRVVPETYSPQGGAAHIDLNTLRRDGDLVVYDVVIPNGEYGRNLGNCQTQETRTLRLGGFDIPSYASYKELNYPWTQSSEYQTKLLEFACSVSVAQR